MQLVILQFLYFVDKKLLSGARKTRYKDIITFHPMWELFYESLMFLDKYPAMTILAKSLPWPAMASPGFGYFG